MAFADIIGQDTAIQSLKNARQNQRMAHAYLFYGTGGVGKESTALAFAKWLNCPRRTADDACDTCPSCRKIASYNHVDVKLIFPRPASLKSEEIQEILQQKARNPEQPLRFEQNVSIVVEDIRELQQQLAYLPYEAETRVIIIREVEKMNVVTANALLKTLEEPPPRTMLILTSNHIHSLLPTIRSRCQQIRFRDLMPAEIEDRLIATYQYESQAARLLAHLANGSLGDVVGLDVEKIAEQRQRGFEFFGKLLRGDVPAMFDLIQVWLKDKPLLDNQLKIITLIYRDLMLIRAASEVRLISNQDQVDNLRKISHRFDHSTIERSVGLIDSCRDALLRNVNPQLTLLHLFFSLKNAIPKQV